jgi:hypothetical protein
MNAPVHVLNWYFGWAAIFAGFVTGAAIGLYFHRDDFLGGYTSFRRRILRLGHISLPALGIINLLFALSPWPGLEGLDARIASIAFVMGGTTMPLVCFLSAWKKSCRHLFFIPVVSLIVAAIHTLKGATP